MDRPPGNWSDRGPGTIGTVAGAATINSSIGTRMKIPQVRAVGNENQWQLHKQTNRLCSQDLFAPPTGFTHLQLARDPDTDSL